MIVVGVAIVAVAVIVVDTEAFHLMGSRANMERHFRKTLFHTHTLTLFLSLASNTIRIIAMRYVVSIHSEFVLYSFVYILVLLISLVMSKRLFTGI